MELNQIKLNQTKIVQIELNKKLSFFLVFLEGLVIIFEFIQQKL